MEWGLAGILKVVLGVALGVPLAFYFLQDRLIFQRQTLPEEQRLLIEQRHPSAQSLFIQAADGTRLHAWHLKPAPGAPLVLYFGGNAEEVSWMLALARLHAPGAGWLLVDYRGYGASEGAPSERALVSDGLQWYDHARQNLGSQNIVLFGRSLGSGVAVQIAAVRPLGGVILVAPYDSLRDVAKHHYPLLPVGLILKHSFDSAQHAPQIEARLLCLAAPRDEVIPMVHSKRLYDAWKGPKRWVELRGAGHNSIDQAPAFWPEVEDFLDKNNAKPA
jgi:pimeloyl-ACP methyl ester carboxylesterase